MSAIDEINKKDLPQMTYIEYAIWTLGQSAIGQADEAANELADFRSKCEAAEAMAERLRAMQYLLRSIQWSGELNGWLVCPSCKAAKKDGHKPDCELAESIKELEVLNV